MSFSSTSSNISLDGAYLRALCADVEGQQQNSGIDLNTCVANIDGILKWAKDGNFAASSEGIQLNGSILTCDCNRTDGTMNSSQLNLDECITNLNGQLSCTC